jgi:AcrR family transcriptional regulator
MSGAETREEIVAVSARLFESHGIAGTTMRAIAAGCSIKAASLYHHFASKDEIVAEVMERSSAFAIGLHDAIAQAADLTPAARIEALMRATLASFRAHPEASRMFVENPRYVADEPLLTTVRANAKTIDALWTRSIDEAIAAGAVRSDIEPTQLWTLLRHMMLAMSRLSGAASGDVSEDAMAILLRGVLVGPADASGEQ